MHGWRFFKKPVGLELYFLKPKLTFTFFLFIFLWQDISCGIGNQTPPSTGTKNKWSVSGNYLLWGALWRCCGNRIDTLDREWNEAFAKSNVGIAAWNGGEKYKSAFGVPWFRAKFLRSQPRWLCEGATAEKTEGGRHDTAVMQCNVACEVKRNEAVLWMH